MFTDQEILQMILKWDSEKPWTIEGSTECHCFPSRKPMRYKILIPQLTMVVSLRFWAFQEFYFYLIITIMFWAVMACRNQIKVFKIFRVPPRARQQRYRWHTIWRNVNLFRYLHPHPRNSIRGAICIAHLLIALPCTAGGRYYVDFVDMLSIATV